MNYCDRYAYRRPKKNKKKHKLLIFFIIQTLILFGMLSYVQNVVNPIIIDYAEDKVDTMATIAVNNAVFQVLNGGISYNDLITVTKDNNGKITMLQANSQLINSIAVNTLKQSQIELDKIDDREIEITLGSLSGIPMLTGVGPMITIEVVPAGSVICDFKSDFIEAGINQTRHRIYIEVRAEMYVLLPVSPVTIENSVEIFITESVLIGDIPDTYFNFSGSDKFDLIPDS